MKLGLVVQEEMSFKEKDNVRTDGGRTKTDHNTVAHLEPSAQVS